jgi:Fanconi-associated nuclease 1
VGDGAAVCAAARDASPADAQLVLDRTGRRLARKANRPWVPLPPLRAAFERVVQLCIAGVSLRPLYLTESSSPAPIEQALVGRLRALGRAAAHAESAPWTTLFGLLLRDVLFAPVPGMLPTAYLRAPLDLGTPGFVTRRRAILDEVLEDIVWGGAATRLSKALGRPREAIAGVHPDLDGAFLQALVAAIPAQALAAILRHMAERYDEARSGLPDLVILPGPEVRIPGAIPALVHGGLVLAELKGPTDSLRDNQRVWIDRLLALGLRVELWTVAPVMRPAA